MPILGWEWINGCLDINASCSTECESAVVSCVMDVQAEYTSTHNQEALHSEEGRTQLVDAYRGCLADNAGVCTSGCGATAAMLHSVEPPSCSCAPGQSDCDCTTSDMPGACPE